MSFQKAQKQLRYNIQKLWFRTTFSVFDWETRTGKSILAEARTLDHKIKRAQFYEIRRELLDEFGIEDSPPDPFEQAHMAYIASLKKDK